MTSPGTSPVVELADDRAALRERWGDFYLLPEGGSNAAALKGCAELGAEAAGYDVVCCPCGTGGTLAGLAAGLDAFIDDFAGRHGVVLDRVYTAKMMFGVLALAERGEFPEGARILAVITG